MSQLNSTVPPHMLEILKFSTSGMIETGIVFSSENTAPSSLIRKVTESLSIEGTDHLIHLNSESTESSIIVQFNP